MFESATSELSVRSSLSFLLGMSMPELCIDPWSIIWDWEKSCISLSVTWITQTHIIICAVCLICFWWQIFKPTDTEYVCANVCLYLFRRQRPGRFVRFFAEVCVFHVGSCRGGSACAQLVLVLVLEMLLVLVREPMSGMYAFTHKALHWLDHVLKVLRVGRWVAL